ncbi:MAG: hypothetical protein R2867_40915 [Caldilineaceae bacterium]
MDTAGEDIGHVDQYVGATKVLIDRGKERRYLVRLGNVAVLHEHFPSQSANLFTSCLRAGVIDIGHHHAGPLLCKAQGNCMANPTIRPRTGDNGDPVGNVKEIGIHSLSFGPIGQ